jgi:hypothetical protein
MSTVAWAKQPYTGDPWTGTSYNSLYYGCNVGFNATPAKLSPFWLDYPGSAQYYCKWGNPLTTGATVLNSGTTTYSVDCASGMETYPENHFAGCELPTTFYSGRFLASCQGKKLHCYSLNERMFGFFRDAICNVGD